MDVILENISKCFGEVKVLDCVTRCFPSEKVSCITGPSGCGKTTMLNILAGLISPDSGTVRGITGRSVAYAFQEPRLLPWKNVRENVEFVLSKSPDGNSVREKAIRSLDVVELSDSLSLLPPELSGGMAQRVSLARALVADAEILLLDEPFSALDNELKYRIMARLKATFRERRTTVIMVTHSAEEAEFFK